MKLKRTAALAILAALIFSLCPAALATAEITAVADPPALAAAGTVQLSVTVTNTGSATMENISIAISNVAFNGTSGTVIPAGESVTFTQNVTIPANLIGQQLPIAVNWTENGEAMSGSTSVMVLLGTGEGGLPAASYITATRTASSSQAAQGEVIVLTYTVTNSGMTPVTGVSITDKEIGGREPMVKDITVEPGFPYVFTYNFTMGRSTVSSAPVISYTASDGSIATVTVEEKALGMINSKISVAVEQGVAAEEGQPFTLILTNDGNQKISKLTVTDELGSAITQEPFTLAIGESRTFTVSIPTGETRNVVFYVNGTDATGTAYKDHTSTYVVRKYIDPSLIGINFSVEVVDPLDSNGTISLSFLVENTGSLEMKNLILSETDYGTLYVLDTVPKGTETISQKINVGSPRDLSFNLALEDPSGNIYSYTAHIKADYVSVEPEPTSAPAVEIDDSLVADVGSSISSALRTVLIVLIILTVIAGIAFIVLAILEKEDRKRRAKKKAQRERLLRRQAAEAAGIAPRPAPGEGEAVRPEVQNLPSDGSTGNYTINRRNPKGQ